MYESPEGTVGWRTGIEIGADDVSRVGIPPAIVVVVVVVALLAEPSAPDEEDTAPAPACCWKSCRTKYLLFRPGPRFLLPVPTVVVAVAFAAVFAALVEEVVAGLCS